MRVGIVSSNWPTADAPTAGPYIAHMVRHLAREADVRVLVPRAAGCFKPIFWREALGLESPVEGSGLRDPTIAVESVEVLRYPHIPFIDRSWQPTLLGRSLWRALQRHGGRQSFDVLNAHWLYPDGAASVAVGRRLGLPVVMTALGSDVHDYLRRPSYARQILKAVEQAQAVTTVSQSLRELLAEAGADRRKLHWIPNGIDAGAFRPRDLRDSRRKLGLAEGPLVVSVARLVQVKRLDVLIRAFAAVQRQLPGARLALVGGGPLATSLKRLAAELQVADSVHFAGTVPHAEVADWVGAADVVALSSDNEGHPNAVVEGLASGRPVVATAVGAVPEIVNSGNGLVVPPGDVEAFAQALLKALTTPWSAAEVIGASSLLSWEEVAGRYRQLMAEVVEAHAATG